MIIIKLTGGLGNQMFQYAFGRSISYTNGVDLKIDKEHFNQTSNAVSETVRKYELGVFQIRENFANAKEINEYTTRKFFPRTILKIKNWNSPKFHVRETSFGFDAKKLNAPQNAYVEGLWQSEKYFKPNEEVIRKDFAFKNVPSKGINKLLFQIQNANSVSIHIRRGDYVTNAQANSHHGVCSLNYYNEAISIITDRIKDPQFFIFSDEIQWAKENLDIGFAHQFIENHPSVHPSEDLRLMSACKHQIIANSSFSWWGAWLNSNNEKIVIAPAQWFLDKSLDTKDLIPEGWIRI
jgi:hypothetical protein